MNKILKKNKKGFIWICSFGLLIFAGEAMAGFTVGSMASTITGSFANLTKLMTAGAYLAGIGFSIGAIMKFKQHKDNPTQVPIGTPVALVFIAAALLFLPTILGMTGFTMFGNSGKTGGPSGIIFNPGDNTK